MPSYNIDLYSITLCLERQILKGGMISYLSKFKYNAEHISVLWVRKQELVQKVVTVYIKIVFKQTSQIRAYYFVFMTFAIFYTSCIGVIRSYGRVGLPSIDIFDQLTSQILSIGLLVIWSHIVWIEGFPQHIFFPLKKNLQKVVLCVFISRAHFKNYNNTFRVPQDTMSCLLQ